MKFDMTTMSLGVLARMNYATFQATRQELLAAAQRQLMAHHRAEALAPHLRAIADADARVNALHRQGGVSLVYEGPVVLDLGAVA